jgi:hypothetical protein
MIKVKTNPSEFKNLKGIEYFQFEEDFMEDNIRCIPMIVRLKLDEVGVKLKLSAWCKFHPEERTALAALPIATAADQKDYKRFLGKLISKSTSNSATELPIDQSPAWKDTRQVPHILSEKSAEFNLNISVFQWQNLTDLKRFALLKLCRPGHENKNFYKAVLEFDLVNH